MQQKKERKKLSENRHHSKNTIVINRKFGDSKIPAIDLFARLVADLILSNKDVNCADGNTSFDTQWDKESC